MTQVPMTQIGGLITVAVPVDDQERALRFYTDTLGFQVRRDMAFNQGMRWIEVAPPGSEVTIALPPRDDVAPGIDTGIRLSTQDVEADHAALRDRGVAVDDDVMRVPGSPPMFRFRDPDGNRLYVVEQRAGMTQR
jgi:predicted enzyme related to lactoylglutathione lyase